MYLQEDVPLVEFMYLVLTRMPAESYCTRLRSLLLCFRALIYSCLLILYLLEEERKKQKERVEQKYEEELSALDRS